MNGNNRMLHTCHALGLCLGHLTDTLRWGPLDRCTYEEQAQSIWVVFQVPTASKVGASL